MRSLDYSVGVFGDCGEGLVEAQVLGGSVESVLRAARATAIFSMSDDWLATRTSAERMEMPFSSMQASGALALSLTLWGANSRSNGLTLVTRRAVRAVMPRDKDEAFDPFSRHFDAVRTLACNIEQEEDAKFLLAPGR
jgi:hypothetical protein